MRGERPENIEYPGAAKPLQQVWIALRANERAILEEVTLGTASRESSRSACARWPRTRGPGSDPPPQQHEPQARAWLGLACRRQQHEPRGLGLAGRRNNTNRGPRAWPTAGNSTNRGPGPGWAWPPQQRERRAQPRHARRIAVSVQVGRLHRHHVGHYVYMWDSTVPNSPAGSEAIPSELNPALRTTPTVTSPAAGSFGSLGASSTGSFCQLSQREVIRNLAEDL